MHVRRPLIYMGIASALIIGSHLLGRDASEWWVGLFVGLALFLMFAGVAAFYESLVKHLQQEIYDMEDEIDRLTKEVPQ